MAKHLLLINPWIYDFAAYDLWLKPLGLLQLAAILEINNCQVSFIDCLDRYHPELLKFENRKSTKKEKYGCGKYFREILEKPEPLKKIPRQYARYGLPIEIFYGELSQISVPDAVLITSGMTYWYPGVIEVIRCVRSKFPQVPIILGGIYASLCAEHARKYSGADLVIEGSELSRIIPNIMEFVGENSPWIPSCFDDFPYPAYHLLTVNKYVCLLTSRGCPFSCSYCASNLLHPRFEQRQPSRVIAEIDYFYRESGIKNFSFYDDALLLNAKDHIHIILDSIIERSLKVNFHAPNALHAKYMTQELAEKLYQGGFKTIRLGLETSNLRRQENLGDKVNNGELETAVFNLREAGFGRNEIGVYVLIGIPGETLEEIRETVAFVFACGAKPLLSEYSPIPGTKLWNEYRDLYAFAEDEPLFHNNSLLGYYPQTRPDLLKFKHEVRMQN